MLVFFSLQYISTMAGYKDGRGNISQGCGDIFFHGHGLSTRGWGFDRGQDYFQKCTYCNWTNHTIDWCWGLHGKSSWTPRATYLCGNAGSSTDMTLIFSVLSLTNLWLSKSDYDSLMQKMHSVSTSDIATLAHLGISYLANSSLSSWITDFAVSTYMTSKSTVFSLFTHLLPLL